MNRIALQTSLLRVAYLLAGALCAVGQVAQTTVVTPPTDTTPGASSTAAQQTPNGVEIEVGIASRILGHQVSNYQSNNGVLTLTNLGAATPQLLTGLGFSCERGATNTITTEVTPPKGTMPTMTMKTTASTGTDVGGFCGNKVGKHTGVFVSAQFGSGTNQTVTGYSVGVTYGLGTHIRLLAGFSETPVSEISPGFRIAASQYVEMNPKLFPGVSSAALASNAYEAFDGIQTTSTAPAAGAAPSNVIYYPGAVTETHYRGGFIIGVAFPINVFNLFSGNSKGQ
jgi:hypothetical protein